VRSAAHLNLSGNTIGAGGAESLAGVLGQCAALAHLNLNFGAAGAESFAGVLPQRRALTHLNRDAGEPTLAHLTEPALTHLVSQPSAGSPQSQLESYSRSRGREFCRSAGTVPSAGSPRSQLQSDWKLSGEGGLELLGVVKPLVFFWRHLWCLAPGLLL
jgi:hypothetical protein